MITKLLLDLVHREYVAKDEIFNDYKFHRELNRETQVYSYYLTISVFKRCNGLLITRSILLGSSPRNK